jgi:hypothetical protein
MRVPLAAKDHNKKSIFANRGGAEALNDVYMDGL